MGLPAASSSRALIVKVGGFSCFHQCGLRPQRMFPDHQQRQRQYDRRVCLGGGSSNGPAALHGVARDRAEGRHDAADWQCHYETDDALKRRGHQHQAHEAERQPGHNQAIRQRPRLMVSVDEDRNESQRKRQSDEQAPPVVFDDVDGKNQSRNRKDARGYHAQGRTSHPSPGDDAVEPSVRRSERARRRLAGTYGWQCAQQPEKQKINERQEEQGHQAGG